MDFSRSLCCIQLAGGVATDSHQRAVPRGTRSLPSPPVSPRPFLL